MVRSFLKRTAVFSLSLALLSPWGFAEDIPWQDTLPDGGSTGARVSSAEGGAIKITGTMDAKSWGSVYRDVPLDLNELSHLQIEVVGADSHWFIILKSDELPEGYVRVQKDTNATGLRTYDLKEITQLAGPQKFRVEVGVSTWDGTPNKGKTMTFKNFQLIEKAKSKNSKSIGKPKSPIEGTISATPWEGDATGAGISPQEDGAYRVTGAMPDRSWGYASSDITVDFDKTPRLQINVLKTTGNWYLILKNEAFEEGYMRIQTDTGETGVRSYDVQAMTQLFGLQDFQLWVGVTSQDGSPNQGQTMVFKDLKFTAGSQSPGRKDHSR